MKTTRNFLIFFCLIFNHNLNSSDLEDRWKYVGNSKKGYSYYFDSSLIKGKDGYLYVWVLQNYHQNKLGGFSSSRMYWMVDCNSMGQQVLEYIFYEKINGEGEATPANEAEWLRKWEYPPPSSIGYKILESACEI